MKHMTKRAAVLMLAAAILASLAACNAPTADGEDTTVAATTAALTADTVTDEVTDAATDAAETTAEDTEPETQPPLLQLTVNESYAIVLSADADEITRNAADILAAAFKDRAGLELAITADGSAATHGIYLETRDFDEARRFEVSVAETAVHVAASDPTTLYFAVEAIAEAWLDPTANCLSDGAVLLFDKTVENLNTLTTRLDHSIRVITQNMRFGDDGNGNSIQNRSQRFRQLLEEYVPDILGTQEFTYNWDVWLKRVFKATTEAGTLPEYGVVGCSREGRNTKNGESNLIFYRTDRFELLDSDTIWLSDTPDQVSCVSGSLCNRICTWALLKDKSTGATILVANTHLDHGTDTVREQQAQILMDYLTQRIDDYPVYLTGDFNTYKGSDAYSTVSETLMDAHTSAWTDASTVSHTFHDYSSWGSEIDFIFHRDNTTPVHYEILSKDYGGFVSDHYGVFAEFVY